MLIIGTTYNPKIRIWLGTIQSMEVKQRLAKIAYHQFHGTAFEPKKHHTVKNSILLSHY